MSSDIVDKETLHQILIGREKLMKLSYDFGALVLFTSHQCGAEACLRARRQLLESWTYDPFDDLTTRKLPIEAVRSGLKVMCDQQKYPCVCKACFDRSARAREDFKVTFWSNLPSIFGLGSWDEVLADN
ncbi:hypothetical protein SCHPADRAFT_946244 [Schizopora paradoxa]|uniref:Uncharacterized protein n=1 Tax=Schizopora paradoxa TaxID=27342 RepID=A0A0H2R9S7_9AGAM|nr:hypothetical protein SCHPADRAFT_946244 [Schizopora paradoxa]